jgi:hypothetical protein
MSFLVIEAAEGLTETGRRRAARTGPDALLTRSTYPSLLRSAGFCDVVFDDRTEEYRATQQAWIAATDRHSAGLREVLGEDAFDERRRARAAALAAIDDGVLWRRRYVAMAPTLRSPGKEA